MERTSSSPSGPPPSFLSTSTSLSKDEVERFSRQIMVEGIGAEGMSRIRHSTVCCVGAGGLGSTIALYLAAAGVGRLVLVDFDTVEVSNLHRQVIHTTDHVGMAKVHSARDACLAVYPEADVVAVAEALTPSNAERIFAPCDVILDGSDNVAARYLINDAAMRLHKPLVSGSAMRWEGQLTVYGLGDACPCYRCLFPLPPPPAAVGSCNDTGVVGPVPGMIGCLQALEAIKIIAKAGEPLAGRMLLFDGLRCSMRVVKLRPRQAATCIACGDGHVLREGQPGNVGQSTESVAEGKAEAKEGVPEPVLSLTELARSRPEYVAGNDCSGGGVALSVGSLPEEARCSPAAFAALYHNKQGLSGTNAGLSWGTESGGDSIVARPKPHVVCIDVRVRIQFDMCHLPGSHSLPLPELQKWKRDGCLAEKARALLEKAWATQGSACTSERDTRLVVFVLCRRGIASVEATKLLRDALGAMTLTSREGKPVPVSIVNVDGGLNAYSTQVDRSFPYY